MQCPSCGTTLSTGMTTCPSCHKPVPNETRLNGMPQRPQIFSAMNITLLAVIVLFLVAGGGGLTYYGQVLHPNDLHAQATVVAETVLQAEGQSTALANLQLSATAAALTPQQIYAQATSGAPVIKDPLTSSKSTTWYQYGTPTNGCFYSGNAYHLKFNRQGSLSCIAFNSLFHDLAFQVQVTILKGDLAGLTFHINNGNLNGYLFAISSAGSYILDVVKANISTELTSGTSNTIYTGLDQPNVLTVIAHDGKIYMFINRQPVAHVSDSTYNSGQVALFGQGATSSTDIAFNNAQVWSL